MSLRKRILDHPFTIGAVAMVFVGYLRLVYWTSRIERVGEDRLWQAVDRSGAVILLSWHQRLMMSPWSIDPARTLTRGLTSTSRMGRLLSRIHRSFGHDTQPLPLGPEGAATLREILRGLRDGRSVGISPDGPRGPARVAKPIPIQWARATQVPLVVYAFSARRYLTVRTWDRLMVPLPFNRLALVWQVWDVPVPRRLTEEETAALAGELGLFMDAVTADADILAGHTGPQV